MIREIIKQDLTNGQQHICQGFNSHNTEAGKLIFDQTDIFTSSLHASVSRAVGGLLQC